MNIKFTIIHRNEPVTDVVIKENEVTIKRYCTGLWQPFYKENPTIKDIYEFLEDRCYENGRGDLKDILAMANMTENNPWEWIKRSHGVTFEDSLWIRFPNEDLTWEDVALR